MATVREAIGQLLMVGVAGEELTQEEQRTLREYPFGGFILFGANCRATDQIAALCRSLWQTGSELPPFIAIDHEGGRVHRLPSSFTHFPAARAIGRTGKPDLAYRIARAMAAELTLVGINLNFAPVLDVDSNPRNPVIADRSFSCQTEDVIRFAVSWIRGFRDGGIIPCGKHFPGHGATAEDSHLELPRNDKTSDELQKMELRPFVHACRERIESMMTAHVVYRALDRELPATLSFKIIHQLLRRKWRYDGVLFSDDLEMKALSDNYTDEECVRLAMGAGIDVLLYGHDLARAVQAFERLTKWSETERTLRARVETSCRRIRALKRRFLQSFTAAPPSELSLRLAELKNGQLCRDVQESL
jgi:beta-N-acetylhexosaminidase